MAAPSGEIGEGGAEVEVVMPVHKLLMRRVVEPMAGSLLLANNRSACQQCWTVKLWRMGPRSSGRWSCWTCRNGAVTLLAAQQSRNRIAQVKMMRRNSNGADDQAELHEKLPWKVAWLLVVDESFVCRSCTVP